MTCVGGTGLTCWEGLRGNRRCRRRCPGESPASPGLQAGACPVRPARLPSRAPAEPQPGKGTQAAGSLGEDGGKGGGCLEAVAQLCLRGFGILIPFRSPPAPQSFPCLLRGGCHLQAAFSDHSEFRCHSCAHVEGDSRVPPVKGPAWGLGAPCPALCLCLADGPGQVGGQTLALEAWPCRGEGDGLGCP